MRVRIRGIYATALTDLFESDHTVVTASEPIRERFDEGFPDAPADVRIDASTDRLGVRLAGTADAVESAADRIREVGADVLPFPAPLPAGALVVGQVTETERSAAIVDCGPADATVPDRAVAESASVGDRVLAQVRDIGPPWRDDRPTLATDLRIEGDLVTLVRSDGGESGPGGSPLAELLDGVAPEGWRVTATADDADIDVLRSAVEFLETRIERMSLCSNQEPESLGIVSGNELGQDGPGVIAQPWSARWLRFGGDARRALDRRRRSVSPTMAGHHRLKVMRDAGDAVDLVEGVCGSTEVLDFDVIARIFGPQIDDDVRIAHGKPGGPTIDLGAASVVARDGTTLTLEREMRSEGTYDGLGTVREAGDVARTTVTDGRWWYPTTYRSEDGTFRGTYVNVCTPIEVFPDAVRYVDLHVDVVKRPDGAVERLDDDELDAAVADGLVPEPLADRARDVADGVVSGLQE